MQNGAGTCVKKWHKTDTVSSAFVHDIAAQKKTAGEFCSLTSGQSKIENVSKTDSSTESLDDAILKAAEWYLANKHDNATRFTPRIMELFGLKPKQVVAAYRIAEQLSKEVRHG